MATVLETAIRSVVTKGIYLLADFNRMRLGWNKTPHPYLTGIHQPMTDEKTLTELTVTGLIPQSLDGRYLRIGPNPIKPNAAGHQRPSSRCSINSAAPKRRQWARASKSLTNP